MIVGFPERVEIYGDPESVLAQYRRALHAYYHRRVRLRAWAEDFDFPAYDVVGDVVDGVDHDLTLEGVENHLLDPVPRHVEMGLVDTGRPAWSYYGPLGPEACAALREALEPLRDTAARLHLVACRGQAPIMTDDLRGTVRSFGKDGLAIWRVRADLPTAVPTYVAELRNRFGEVGTIRMICPQDRTV